MDEKIRILNAQSYKCALCGEALSVRSVEFDHKTPVCLSMESKEAQQLQAVHTTCHATKTSEEERPLDRDPLTSHCSLDVFAQFIEAPIPPALVWCASESGLEVGGALILDVRRCRKRCLEFTPHPLPILSPLSSIEAFQDQDLGDFVFVTAPYKDFVSQFGYSGPGWIHVGQARWLLHMRVLTWADVRFRIRATAHLPHDCLQEPLAIIEECWQEPEDKKLSVNSLLGLFLRRRTNYRVTTSRSELDAPEGTSLQTTVFFGDNDCVHDWVTEEVVRTPQTKYPIWLMVMCSEQTRVGQAIWILERLGVPRASLGEFKTDSVAFKPSRRKLKKIREEIADVRYCDLHSLRDSYGVPVAKGQQRLTDVVSCLPTHSGEIVYRCGEMEERDRMKTRPELPRREPWTVTLAPQTWTELSPEEARAHILAGNSCLITGPAGSGKSTLVAHIIKELRAERPVALISKTHVASQNMQAALEKALEGEESAASGGEAYQATTADAFTRRHVCHGTYAGAIWLDEYSTLDFQQYCLLNALTYNGCQFVVSGDVNQMGACFSSFRGIPVDSDEIAQSSFFYQLCGAHVCRLTECRRSDRPLFDWYTSVGAGGSRHGLPLAEQVRQARAAFPAAGRARWHLVVSHFKRLAINRREMLRQRL